VKVEYVFATSSHSGFPPVAHSLPVYYYRSGEFVAPGYYVCTFCGHTTHVSSSRALSACEHCDSTEFARSEAA
jgi:hypothetical protein